MALFHPKMWLKVKNREEQLTVLRYFFGWTRLFKSNVYFLATYHFFVTHETELIIFVSILTTLEFEFIRTVAIKNFSIARAKVTLLKTVLLKGLGKKANPKKGINHQARIWHSWSEIKAKPENKTAQRR